MATDYYDIFKNEKFPLDPKKDKEYNYNQLTRLSSYYTQLHGSRAEIMLNQVKEAQKIFTSDDKYKEYRQTYVEDKLRGFMEGAVVKKNIYKDDYTRLLNKGKESGIEKIEVDNLLKLTAITILNDERPEKVSDKSEKELEHAREELRQEKIRIENEKKKIEEEKIRIIEEKNRV